MIEWYIFALVSAIFSATAAILEKKILFKDNIIGFTTLLAIFNLILAIPFLFFIESKITSIGLLILFFKSFLGAVAFLCIMYGIKNLEVSSALPLLVLTPGLVAFFAFIFLGEALTFYEIFGIFFLIIGIYVLQLNKNQKLLDPFKSLFKSRAYIYLILALILFTTTSILDKTLLKQFNMPINGFMFFQHLFFAIIFILFIILSKKTKEIKYSLKFSWKLILILSIVTIIYRYGELQAVKTTAVALAISIKRISVFFAVVIGGKIFREKNLFRKTIATIIMTLGAILIIFS